MIFKLTLGDWECDGYYANKDYFFESNYSAERITEAYKASCRKYGVQFNSAKHDYTGLGRENLDRRRLVWASYDEPSMSREVYRLFVELGLIQDDELWLDKNGLYHAGEDNVLKIIMGFIAPSMPDDFSYKLLEIPRVNALIHYQYQLRIVFNLKDVFRKERR